MIKFIPVALVALVVSACTATQVGSAVQEGQLVCAVGPTVVAMANQSGAVIMAKGAAKASVDAVCALVNGIAVSPPGQPVPTATVALPSSVNIPLR